MADRKLTLTVVLTLIGLIHLISDSALKACPFCLAPPNTLAVQIDEADVILVGEMVGRRLYERQIQVDVNATTQFRIVRTIKAPGMSLNPGSQPRRAPMFLRPGQIVTIPGYNDSAPEELCLLIGRFTDTGAGDNSQTYDLAGSEETGTDVDKGVQQASASSDSPESSGGILKSGGTQTAAFEVDTASADAASEASGDSTAETRSFQRASLVSLVVPELLEWDSPTPVTPERLEYILGAPAVSVPKSLRLPYYINWLESADEQIAADAWAEFAGSPYEDVVSVTRLYPREKLRQWVANPDTNPERLGLFGMMLGLCGQSEDAALMQELIGEPRPSKDFRYGIEGVMGGYLLLTGEAGLRYLEDSRLKTPGVAAEELFAVVSAIQYMWSYESTRIDRSRLRESLHGLLHHPDMQEIVITDLARWKDWPTAPKLMQMFESEAMDDRGQKAVVQFAIALTRDAAKNKGPDAPTGEQLQQSRDFLAMVEQKHPQLLRHAARDFGPPQ